MRSTLATRLAGRPGLNPAVHAHNASPFTSNVYAAAPLEASRAAQLGADALIDTLLLSQVHDRP